MIEMDLRTYLLAQSTITDLVSQRIYPLRLPQGVTLPAITYQVVAGASLYSHDGGSDFGRRRVQIDVWTERYQSVIEVADAVRNALSGYLGPMGSTPYVAGRVVNILDLPEPEIPLWRRMVEAQLWNTEAA